MKRTNVKLSSDVYALEKEQYINANELYEMPELLEALGEPDRVRLNKMGNVSRFYLRSRIEPTKQSKRYQELCSIYYNDDGSVSPENPRFPKRLSRTQLKHNGYKDVEAVFGPPDVTERSAFRHNVICEFWYTEKMSYAVKRKIRIKEGYHQQVEEFRKRKAEWRSRLIGACYLSEGTWVTDDDEYLSEEVIDNNPHKYFKHFDHGPFEDGPCYCRALWFVPKIR